MDSSDSDDPNFLLRLLPGDDEEAVEATADEHHHHHDEPLQAEEDGRDGDGASTVSYNLHSIGAAILAREIRRLGLSFQLWPSALSLLRLLDLHPDLLPLPPRRPLRIIELGSGTGLPAIAAAALLPAFATLTDLPHVLPNLHLNASLNLPLVLSRGGQLSVLPLRWGHSCDLTSLPRFDIVLASDVVYYHHLVDPLLETARELVKGETVWLMAHLRRWRRTDAAFFRKAKKVFDVGVVLSEEPAEGSRIGVVVYKFMEKRRKESSGGS